MRRTARVLLQTTVVSLVVVAVGPLSTAAAAQPNVTITSPLTGSTSNNRTPSFKGRVEEARGEVTLTIHRGPGAEGAVVKEIPPTQFFSRGAWFVGPAELLNDGTYTALATQTELTVEIGRSSPVTFTVDTGAPTVALNPPQSPSSNRTPSFTGSARDTTPATAQ